VNIDKSLFIYCNFVNVVGSVVSIPKKIEHPKVCNYAIIGVFCKMDISDAIFV
jgi:hypothetical protein